MSQLMMAVLNTGAAHMRLAYTRAAMEVTPSDEELMLRFSAGDAAAFEALYARHRGGVFRYLLRQCRNEGIAEELFQDIWMNLIQARARYRVEAKFATYLYTVAHNRLMDHFRRAKGHELLSLDDEESGAPELAAPSSVQPEEAAQSRQMARRVLDLLAKLPVAQRDVFLLYEEGGLSLEQIASVTGATREAVKSRLRYAIGKLRRDLNSDL